MKKRILCAITSITCACVMLLLGAGCSPNADDKFLDLLEESVSIRMENSNQKDYASLVNNELAILNQYRDEEFEDDAISQAASMYLEGLDKQKEALTQEHYGDYQVEWREGMALRYDALKKLYENYGFMEDNTEFVADYIMKTDDIKLVYDAMCQMTEDTGIQCEEETIEYDYDPSSYTFSMKLTNNTEHTYHTQWNINFCDTDGNLLYSGIADATSLPDSTYTVNAYLPYDIAMSGELTWHWDYTFLKIDGRDVC